MTRERPLKNPAPRGKVPRRKLQTQRPELTAAQKRELIDYFTQRGSQLRVVETTKTPSGHIVDWIDIRSQRPDGEIATPPPDPEINTAKLRGRATRMASGQGDVVDLAMFLAT